MRTRYVARRTPSSRTPRRSARTRSQTRSRELEDTAKHGSLDGAEKQLDLIAEELATVQEALPAAWDEITA